MVTTKKKKVMKPPAAPKRSIRLLRSPLRDGVGVMAITSGRDTNYYVFREFRSDIGGRAFSVHRLGLGNVYHVRIGAPEECSCDCLGFLHRSKCKHVLGLLALAGHELV